MDKMKFESPDLTAQNIDRIAALFPNCITEMLDEEHSTPEKKVYKRAVNFELLKQMLSELLDPDGLEDVVIGIALIDFRRRDDSSGVVFHPPIEVKSELDRVSDIGESGLKIRGGAISVPAKAEINGQQEGRFADRIIGLFPAKNRIEPRM